VRLAAVGTLRTNDLKRSEGPGIEIYSARFSLDARSTTHARSGTAWPISNRATHGCVPASEIQDRASRTVTELYCFVADMSLSPKDRPARKADLARVRVELIPFGLDSQGQTFFQPPQTVQCSSLRTLCHRRRGMGHARAGDCSEKYGGWWRRLLRRSRAARRMVTPGGWSKAWASLRWGGHPKCLVAGLRRQT